MQFQVKLNSNYFIENKDSISTSFSKILGSLMSVIAQNITVQFKTNHPVKLLSDYSQKDTRINLGDLYVGEEKIFFFLLNFQQLALKEKINLWYWYYNIMMS